MKNFMAKQKHVGFAVGFVSGVVFTFVFWCFLEGKLNDLFAVKDHVVSADQEMPAAQNTAAPSVEPAGEFVFDRSLSAAEMEGPSSAPVTIHEFTDFYCPYCGRAEKSLKQVSESYKGKVHRVIHHFPLPFHQGAERIHQAAECAREQGRFWEFYTTAFSFQPGLRAEDAPEKIARLIGADPDQLKNCLQSGKYEVKVKEDMAEGQKRGISGTPGFFVNDFKISGAMPYGFFAAAIDHFLDPSKPLPRMPEASKPVPEPPKQPVTFSDLAGKPTKGTQNARVTLVEFSDFHCPFCARASSTVDQLMKTFPNDLRRVWRHNPLPMHPGAEKTHIASECAADQGKFWEYHDAIFASQGRLSEPDFLKQTAQSLQLDMPKFEKCVQEESTKDRIAKDVAKAREIGATGTPIFFVNGQWLRGAQPFEAFQQAVSEALKKAS